MIRHILWRIRSLSNGIIRRSTRIRLRGVRADKNVRKWFKKVEKWIAGLVIVGFVISVWPIIYADAAEPAVDIGKIEFTQDQLNPVQYRQDSVLIAVVESRHDEKQRQLAEAMAKRVKNREAVSRSAIDRLDAYFEPDLFLKRALAKRAAEAAGISEHWKLVEAVWQVESGKRWQTSVRSYAGAQGPMQFMRGTWERNKVDGNGDGRFDINHAEDAVFAGANLLANAGLKDGNVDRALLAYNHATWYVKKVKKVADSIVE